MSTILFFLLTFITFSYSKFHQNSVVQLTNDFVQNTIVAHFSFCDVVWTQYYTTDSKNNVRNLVIPNLIGIVVKRNVNLNSKEIMDNKTMTLLSSEKNVNKLRNTGCAVVIIDTDIMQISKPISLHLFQTLTPHYLPITKKDEDYFVFLGHHTHKLMTSPEFGLKIKYKIGFYSNQGSSRIYVNSIHPYQNYGGPQLITLFELDDNSINNPKKFGPIQIFPDFTRNHFGRNIKISIPKAIWRFEMELGPDKHYHPKRGYYGTWLEGAMRKFNFSTDLFPSSLEGGTGVLFKNGTWGGAVGDVYNEQAEIAFVIGHIYSRHKYVEWSAPLSYEWMIFVCHDQEQIYSAKSILWPLRWDSWILLGICTLFAILVLKLFFIFRMNGHIRSREWSSSEINWYIYKTIMEQDAIQPGKDLTWLRVFCGFWLLFVAVGTTAYRAKLVSVLAFPLLSWVPETFEELAESNFRTGLNVVGKGGAAYDLFYSSTSPTFMTIVKKLSLHPNALECVTKAGKDDFCCCLWEGASVYEMNKNITDRFGRSGLKISRSTTFFIDDGLVYQKRAIFRHHFDLTIWNAIQMGLVNKWIKTDMQLVRKARRSSERKDSTYLVRIDDGPKELNAQQLLGGVVIMVVGHIAGLVILLGEAGLTWWRWRKYTNYSFIRCIKMRIHR